LLRRDHADPRFTPLIDGGIAWLQSHQNPDGGWGDTVLSVSNISTSMLVRAAIPLAGATVPCAAALTRLELYLERHCGNTPTQRAEAIRRRYGKDRTFAVPILVTCALADLVSWNEVTPLPFELACFPQRWFRFLGIPVVSYALPALIAIGQAIHHYRPSWNPLVRLLRRGCIAKSLRVLQDIQPTSGGYLEAIPLTSFVTLSLASIGRGQHPVAQKGLEFIVQSVRPDGSWPIDTNLATWVTTLAVNALANADDLDSLDRQEELQTWLVNQQFRVRHPFTGAAPGGFGWSDLPGALPDADDTPGAVIALRHLSPTKHRDCLARADAWILGLQNRDGGWPTFCRGFGSLPFDRSGTDLTAHNLRALNVLQSHNPDAERLHAQAQRRGLVYLERQQRADGSWLPLWFGNQYAPDDENPTYGTVRALAAYRDLAMLDSDPAQRGVAWLLRAQNADGGWGGASGVPSSVEETALALEIVLGLAESKALDAAGRGLTWLVDKVEAGEFRNPSPIGFYFAKLWYFEKLYPIIFLVAALGRARLDNFRIPLAYSDRPASSESPTLSRKRT
jgi:squalene-hopene/tetraprenyl-beta-curcumene cyclase